MTGDMNHFLAIFYRQIGPDGVTVAALSQGFYKECSALLGVDMI